MLAEWYAGSDDEKSNVISLLPEFLNSRYTCVILMFVGDAILNLKSFKDIELSADLIADGHATATYYVMTQK